VKSTAVYRNYRALIFKLRTARQLIVACKDENVKYQQALKSADIDDETKTRLEELGYL